MVRPDRGCADREDKPGYPYNTLKGNKQRMGKQDDKFTFEAEVVEALPNAMFKVRLPNEQKTEVLAYVSGKMRMNYIRILPGDRVTVEISPYDLTKARITFRH